MAENSRWPTLRRSRLRTGMLLAFAVLPLAAAAAACGGSSGGSGSAATPSTLTIGLNNAPVSLNPALDTTESYMTVRPLTNAALIHENQNGTFSPELATSWGYVGSGEKTFQFTLRHNARFSDGTLVTAAAYKTWLTYYNKVEGGLTFVNFGTHPISSITTSGKWTVVIHMSFPNPGVVWALSDANNTAAIESPELVAHPSEMSTETDGAGPYVLDVSQSAAGSVYTYVPNKYYYDKSAIRFKKIVAKVITTPSTMLDAVRTGQVQFAYGDATTAKSAAGVSGVTVEAAPTQAYVLNLDNGGTISSPLANVKVRQALNYAINRKTLAAGLTLGYGGPWSEPVSSNGLVTSLEHAYPYDLAKAKSLMAAAGYAKGFTVSALGEEGTQTTMEAVAQQLKAINVTLNLSFPSSSAQWASEIEANKSYGITLAGMNFSRNAYENYFTYFAPQSFYDITTSWSDPVMQGLAAQGAASSSASAWQQITSRVVAQAYMAPMYTTDAIYYVSKHLQGVDPTDVKEYPNALDWTWSS
jgi:peptide/nickel transport system substrate-binding protein